MDKKLMCSENPCSRCGCDFPNIPRFKKNCGSCETPKEMAKRSMNQLHRLLNSGNQGNAGIR